VRAVVHDRYGPPDVLRLKEVERPVPEGDEVLVRIHATTVNRTDCGFRSAEYFVSRFFTGLLRPKRRIDMELAGEVEAVGAAVTEFAGKYPVVIDRSYRLEDVVEATRYVETGQKTGNVVLTVNGGRAR
jgi:NADPH:quinone reductase-like Zn-dependent oxidoreductase